MRWTPFVGAALGLAWYVKAVGGHTLRPTELGWLADGDVAAHLLGWLFFRNETWTWPLGTIDGLLHPIGTTLGFTDANPWVSLLLKPLSPLLPPLFQFIGPWMALCFALQGVFGAKIMEALTPDWRHQVLGAALFVLAPPLLHRIGHPTLSAHWLLLALVWLHVRRGGSPRRTVGLALAFNVIAAGVHPYLAVMLIVLTLALLVRLVTAGRPAAGGGRSARDRLSPAMAGVAAATLVLQAALIFWSLGYLGSGARLSEGGFGIYSADLLTFFNPMTHSRLLPAFGVGEGQVEGFAFLGSGVLALALVGGVLHVVQRRAPVRRSQAPLVAAASLMAVFALSNAVTAGGHVVLTMRSAYGSLMDLLEPFRASGRFIWPLFYVVLTGILSLIVRPDAVRPAAATGMLLAAVLVQAAEVTGVWPGTRLAPGRWPQMSAPAWDALGPPYRHLVLYPPFFTVATPACAPTATSYPEVVRLSELAYRNGLTFNSAYVARYALDALDTYCGRLHADIASGRFAPDTVYVVRPESLAPFMSEQGGVTCGSLDGFNVCVSDAGENEFRRMLAAGSG